MTWECDSNRHMNVMYYINKFELGGRNFTLEMGLNKFITGETVGMVALEQLVKYHKEAFEDDLLYTESSLVKIGSKAFTILHEMYNAETKDLIATMQVVLCLFDKVNRKALPFPDELRQKLSL